MNLRERLTSTPQFRELSPEEIGSLAAAMELIESEDGHVFIKEGTRGDGCFLIVEGGVRISHDRDGQTHRRGDINSATVGTEVRHSNGLDFARTSKETALSGRTEQDTVYVSSAAGQTRNCNGALYRIGEPDLVSLSSHR